MCRGPKRSGEQLKTSSKIFYCTNVVAYGILCIITKLEFFQHQFFETGHRNTSCDPHLHLSHQANNAALPHAKRPPPGGYVQTRKPAQYVSVPIYPPNAVLLFTMAVGTVRSVKTDWPFSVRPVRVLRRQNDLVCLPFCF